MADINATECYGRESRLSINQGIRHNRQRVTRKKRNGQKNIVGLIYLRSGHAQEKRIRNHRIWNKVGEFDVISDCEMEDEDDLPPLKDLNQLQNPRGQKRFLGQGPFLLERGSEGDMENKTLRAVTRSRSATVPHPQVADTMQMSRASSERIPNIIHLEALQEAGLRSTTAHARGLRSLSIRVVNTEVEDPRKLKRAHALAEILYQEKVYVASLNELINDFLDVIDMQGIFDTSTQEQFHKLTLNRITKILRMHQELEKALNRECCPIDGGKCVNVYNGDLLVKMSYRWAGQFHRIANDDALELYKIYIADYDTMILMIEDERESNPNFFKFLREKEKARRSLFSFLILPVQQITRYRLTFKKLQMCCHPSDPDWKQINHLTTRFEECPKHINEYQKENIERMTQLSVIMSLISDMPQSVVDAQRRFIEQIKVRKPNKSAFSTSKYNRLFLFNDILIVTNQRYRFRRYFDLSQTVITYIKPQTLQLKVSEKGKIYTNKWTVLKVKTAKDFLKKWNDAKKNQTIAEESDYTSQSELSLSYSLSAFETSADSLADWHVNYSSEKPNVTTLRSAPSLGTLRQSLADRNPLSIRPIHKTERLSCSSPELTV